MNWDSDETLTIDNSSDLINNTIVAEEIFHTFYYISYGIVTTVLVIFGVFGNLLTIGIFSRQNMWSSINYYLIVLAAWDTFLLLSSFLQFSVWVLYDRLGSIRVYGDHAYVLRYAYVFINTSLTGCVWIIVTVTIERYMAIRCPLRHRALNNAKRARGILLGVCLSAILFNLVRFYEVEVVIVDCMDCDNKISPIVFGPPVALIRPSELAHSQIFFIAYKVIGNCLLVFLLPCTVLTVLTVRMCFSIHKAHLERHQMSFGRFPMIPVLEAKGCTTTHISKRIRRLSRTVRRVDSHTNRALALAVIKFLFCYTLPTVLDVLQVCMSESDYYTSCIIEYTTVVSNVLVVLNSSCNFFIYFFCGRRFRTECVRLIFLWKSFNTRSSNLQYKSATCSLIETRSPQIRYHPRLRPAASVGVMDNGFLPNTGPKYTTMLTVQSVSQNLRECASAIL